MRAQIKSFNLLLHSCLFMKWNTDWGFWLCSSEHRQKCVCGGEGSSCRIQDMFHVEHKMRLSNMRFCSLCLIARNQFSSVLLRTKSTGGIAQWSDHMALGFSEDSLACNLSSVLN